MKTILIAEPDGYDADAIAAYRGLGEVRLGLDGRSFAAAAADCDVLVLRLRHRVDAAVVAAAPRLAAVVSPTTGLDHLDLPALERAGAFVVSLHGQTEFLRTIVATAELTWGLLLAVTRRVAAAASDVVAGRWDRDRFIGTDLSGKTLGILGLGRIGAQVAGYGRAFGMRVLAHDPVPRPELAEPVEIDRLFEVADVLSVHLPLTEATRGLVGRGLLFSMKPGSVLINTSRGAILDESALADALTRGPIAGAGLDVLDGEPLLAGLGTGPIVPLIGRHRGLVVTPHLGGASADAMRATERFCARRLVERFSTG